MDILWYYPFEMELILEKRFQKLHVLIAFLNS